MSFTPLITIILVAAVLIIAALAFYAGQLLFQLKRQKQQQHAAVKQREDYLRQSIQTIAQALDQQQCGLSEGSIRLCVLLENFDQASDHAERFPALHELYGRIKHMPTHKAYSELPKPERRRMQLEREEHEAELESQILKEIQVLKSF